MFRKGQGRRTLIQFPFVHYSLGHSPIFQTQARDTWCHFLSGGKPVLTPTYESEACPWKSAGESLHLDGCSWETAGRRLQAKGCKWKTTSVRLQVMGYKWTNTNACGRRGIEGCIRRQQMEGCRWKEEGGLHGTGCSGEVCRSIDTGRSGWVKDL